MKVNYKLLSSEQTNQKLIQKHSLEFPEMTPDELFRYTRPFYRKFYDEQIREIFLEIYQEVLDKAKLGSECEIYLVYVDKNHPLNHRSQAPIHRRFRNISNFDQLKFVSVNLVALEVENDQERVERKLADIPRWATRARRALIGRYHFFDCFSLFFALVNSFNQNVAPPPDNVFFKRLQVFLKFSWLYHNEERFYDLYFEHLELEMIFQVEVGEELDPDCRDKSNKQKVSRVFYEQFQHHFLTLMNKMNGFQKENRELFRLKPKFNSSDQFGEEKEEPKEEISFEDRNKKRFELEKDFLEQISEDESANKLKNLVTNVSFKIVCVESMQLDFQSKLEALFETLLQFQTNNSTEKKEFFLKSNEQSKHEDIQNSPAKTNHINMQIKCDIPELSNRFLQAKDALGGESMCF